MKILLISDFFPMGKDLRFSGGVEARTFFIAKYLSKKHKVYVITTRLPKTKIKEKMYNFTVFRPGPMMNYNSGAPSALEAPYRFLFILSAVKLGKKLNVDIVDGGNFVDHFIARWISILNKIPIVFWYPDVFIGQWIKTSGILGGIAGYILEKFNLVLSANNFIAISNETKRKLIREGVHTSKINVIPCGVELSEYRRKSYKQDTIITISRLVNYKRIKDLILAFAKVKLKNPNLKLKIIGSGPKKNEFKSFVKNLKLEKSISFFENLPRKRLIEKLLSSRIFCLPSEIEGFGISVIEAAAAGVPYVISDIPVFKEITENGKGGLLFKLGSISDLANKLEILISNSELYNQKRQEGLLLAKRYNWEKISPRTEEVYKKLLKNR